ncbi:MAG TPA: 4-alpha-glucanotransferase [Stellaceae bacterium]|nr:4-alpha-glucanotransferase [Stellaceae bacterium]
MSEGSELARLAARLGIAPRFTDALGVGREVSEATFAALVAGFGLSPDDPGRSLRETEEEENARPLGLSPFEIVAAEAETPSLALLPPAGAARIEWACRFEDGGECAGVLDLAASESGGRVALPLPAPLPLGYHRLDLASGGVGAQVSLVVAPPCCHLPAALGEGARSWGVTCQLYGLRSAGSWGIGDFTDLANLARALAAHGAGVLGVNPLHALFAAEPRHRSPYSPSSRAFLDYLYIDVTAVPGFAEDRGAGALFSDERLKAARAGEFVDYAAVAAVKRPVLEALFRSFRKRARGAEAFRRFREAGGKALGDFAAFEALDEHFRKMGVFSWREWPAELRSPNSPAVADFAGRHHDRVEFFQFLQWEADRQLGAAAAAGRAPGLALGLYRDLAVGADPGGAEAWADQELLAPGIAIGAPPDALNRVGQNWGLAPVSPLALRRQGFAPFIAALRANMRHAGVLRIDHVMSLARLYWIPRGRPATEGAYVAYPFEDLLRILALESRRQQCAVIGEDLGTVPEGFRERMRGAGVLSYRVAAFERRRDGGFLPPGEYPPLAAAASATHDIATVTGFWLGRDLEWRRRLGLYPDRPAAEAEAAERERDRRRLAEALAGEGLLAPEEVEAVLPPAGELRFSAPLLEAILAHLARSRSRLLLVQLEDLLGEAEQANLPGTTDEHPNWRRRIARPLEQILADPEFARLLRLVRQERDGDATAGPHRLLR